MQKLFLIILVSSIAIVKSVNAQGSFSGDFQANYNFYQRDSTIGAVGELYDKYLNGGEAWLTNRYSNNKGFTASLRIDIFNNSNLLSPGTAYNAYGIGAFQFSKEIGDLTVTAGYIYDQIGSGILFRSYEDRGLLIDNALEGLALRYKPAHNIVLKAFTGQQKQQTAPQLNGRYNPIIKGLNAEGDFSAGTKVHLSPGIGLLNRTIDGATMSNIASRINAQDLSTRFVPTYNMYAFTLYNTLTAGDFSWYVEGAFKSHEAIDNTAILIDAPGNVVYSTLGYAIKGIAVNLSGKRTENFEMRTSPQENLLKGMLNWQPVVSRIRSQRLMSRYSPAAQNLSEVSGSADVILAPKEDLDITLNYTHIDNLTSTKLYREIFGEVEYRGFSKWILIGGAQYLNYNQEVYQVRPGVPMVEAITPFAEATYRFNAKKSLKLELEYMDCKQDYGSWAFALLEFNIAPKWSFSLSDMYITKLNPNNISGFTKSPHYYNVFMAYTAGPHRFTLSYVKQPDGINCTGGVCRYEPAFSGVRLGVTTSW